MLSRMTSSRRFRWLWSASATCCRVGWLVGFLSDWPVASSGKVASWFTGDSLAALCSSGRPDPKPNRRLKQRGTP